MPATHIGLDKSKFNFVVSLISFQLIATIQVLRPTTFTFIYSRRSSRRRRYRRYCLDFIFIPNRVLLTYHIFALLESFQGINEVR